MWFWPGQTWDHHRIDHILNRDLHEFFGIEAMWAKTLFGAVVVGGYFAIGGFVLDRLLKKFAPEIVKKQNKAQYLTTVMLVLLMFSLPAKIFLRLAFTIKYVWVTPWFNI
jgi:hypothetical protein